MRDARIERCCVDGSDLVHVDHRNQSDTRRCSVQP